MWYIIALCECDISQGYKYNQRLVQFQFYPGGNKQVHRIVGHRFEKACCKMFQLYSFALSTPSAIKSCFTIFWFSIFLSLVVKNIVIKSLDILDFLWFFVFCWACENTIVFISVKKKIRKNRRKIANSMLLNLLLFFFIFQNIFFFMEFVIVDDFALLFSKFYHNFLKHLVD